MCGSSTLQVAQGFNHLDFGGEDGGWHVRGKTNLIRRSENYFCLGYESWAGSALYSAGTSWLRVPNDHPLIQCGEHDMYRSDYMPMSEHMVQDVQFDREFTAPPTVLVVIRGFDLGTDHKLSVYANSITQKGFTLNAETWNGAEMIGVFFTYIAFHSNDPQFASGEVWGTYNTSWSGTITFKHAFTKPPKVFAAISKFDVNPRDVLRCKINISNITTTTFYYSIETWGDTRIYEIRGQYFAIP
ncbi:hypothetical protein C8J56DRAFT_828519 [Mycena floridula]|nr:hypothetical protein C8J56DRAFT_828519 [Mycena floridula]